MAEARQGGTDICGRREQLGRNLGRHEVEGLEDQIERRHDGNREHTRPADGHKRECGAQPCPGIARADRDSRWL